MNYDICRHQGFIRENLEGFIEGTKAIIKHYYNEKNLEDHSAYFSDIQPGRISYAFTIWNSSDPINLPAINVQELEDHFKGFTALHQEVLKKLKIVNPSRILFNVQLYYSPSSPVCRHFDGELMSFSREADGSLKITSAIRPKHVALLTLVNSAKNGGTRFFYRNGNSQLIQSKPGNLLMFDNIKYEHSVDQFSAETISRNDGLIRMIIGWRSLDTNCLFWTNNGKSKELTFKEANSIYKTWLTDQYPNMYNLYKLSIQEVLF
ncbi:hypothetical protein [Nostoc sp.]|uniref:hypothetical protein n=1 Tax=Nostoc sp. TaxID=1180 RepID=UPI002FF5FBAF